MITYLDKIIDNKIMIDNHLYPLNDSDFKTIDPACPYQLNDIETEIIQELNKNFKNSSKLHNHIKFLLNNGSVYKICNHNLLFHGCIPLDFYGNFISVDLGNQKLAGKKYFDYLRTHVENIE